MIERRRRFHQLIKNSKNKRCDKDKNVEQSKRNQEMTDCIEKQADEIEHMQEEHDELKLNLEDHSRDTDLLKHLYDGGNIDMNGDPIPLIWINHED